MKLVKYFDIDGRSILRDSISYVKGFLGIVELNSIRYGYYIGYTSRITFPRMEY